MEGNQVGQWEDPTLWQVALVDTLCELYPIKVVDDEYRMRDLEEIQQDIHEALKILQEEGLQYCGVLGRFAKGCYDETCERRHKCKDYLKELYNEERREGN